jgi:hypothetical protein
MIKLRIILETKEDVIREIAISKQENLEQLHHSIIKHFNLDEFEMASFYRCNANLELGEEISLFDTSENGIPSNIMNNNSISSILFKEESQLVYVYDFLKMWRFHIQFVEENENLESGCIKSVGEVPDQAPEINFEEERKEEFNPNGDAFDDSEEFDNYEY